MNRGNRIAAVLLWIHGSIELMSLMALLPASKAYLPGGIGDHLFAENVVFVMVIGSLWGVIRWILGFGVWRSRRWAAVAAIIISGITLQAAVGIVPFGIMDTILAAPVLLLLLHGWFGKTTISSI